MIATKSQQHEIYATSLPDDGQPTSNILGRQNDPFGWLGHFLRQVWCRRGIPIYRRWCHLFFLLPGPSSAGCRIPRRCEQIPTRLRPRWSQLPTDLLTPLCASVGFTRARKPGRDYISMPWDLHSALSKEKQPSLQRLCTYLTLPWLSLQSNTSFLHFTAPKRAEKCYDSARLHVKLVHPPPWPRSVLNWRSHPTSLHIGIQLQFSTSWLIVCRLYPLSWGLLHSFETLVKSHIFPYQLPWTGVRFLELLVWSFLQLAPTKYLNHVKDTLAAANSFILSLAVIYCIGYNDS